MKNTVFILVVLLPVLACQARTIYVDDDGPADFNNIQAAIDDANNGDTVIVAPGTYTGHGNRDIDFLGKAITVRSTDPNDPNIVANTIIDCNGIGRGFKFHSGEGPNSVLAGLTITNGRGPVDGYIHSRTRSVGGGIFCEDSHPTITYCMIMNNFAVNGGAICCDNSSAVFTNCIISGNTSYNCGGGIYCYNSTPALTNCIFVDNSTESGGGGMDNYKSHPNLTNCIFIGNSADWGGGAICNSLGSFTINNCTITGNSAKSGAGINCGTATISNCIIWGNSAEDGTQIRGSEATVVSFCNVQGGWSGEGNIDTDPRFVDGSGGDYHLSLYSLCINAGDPCYSPASGETDIDGEPRVINGCVDIGADEVDYEGPFLGISPTKFAFDANEGGPNPEPQIMFIRNAGIGIIDWEISFDCNWLNVEPDGGSSAGEIDEVTLTVDTAGLTLGKYNCSLTILAPGIVNSPQTATVDLHIRRPIVYVPGDFPTIQEAIDDVLEGSTVIVADGVYRGEGNRNIDFRGKAITVRSENGPENCIINCRVAGDPLWRENRGFHFHSGEDGSSVLDGFTIINGSAAGCAWVSGGGGILCYCSSPTITNCIIRDNIAYDGCVNILDSHGGGIQLEESSPTITNCVISGNLAFSHGGGLTCLDGSPVIANCIIAGNSAARGSGLSFGRSSPILRNCTFAGNTDEALYCSRDTDATVTNCIFWTNAGHQIRIGTLGYADRPYPATVTILYSDVQGSRVYVETGSTLNWGPGNIDTDPCFAQPGYWDPNGTPAYPVGDVWVDGDYHLQWDSPCINAGDPNFVPKPEERDIDGEPRVWDGRVDMGADEFVPAIEVLMKFTPQALNPKSKGNWVKAHLVLPEGFIVEDVDVSRPAVIEPLGIESDYLDVFINEDGLVEIEAGFDRAAFCAAGPIDGTVTVIGAFGNGQYFYGTDTIKIITNNLQYLGVLASHWLEQDCGKPDWCSGLDVDQDSVVNFVDFAMFDGDCIVDFRDFSLISLHWLQDKN